MPRDCSTACKAVGHCLQACMPVDRLILKTVDRHRRTSWFFFFNDENQSNRRLDELLRLHYNMYNILDEFQQCDKFLCIFT